MPRPYGWSDGEGRYKALSGLGTTPGVQTSITNPDTGMIVVGDNWFTDVVDSIDNSLPQEWQSYRSNITDTNLTMGEWINKNKALLLVGAITGLLLFKR